MNYSELSPELQDLFREVDEALEAYAESITKGLELSRDLIASCEEIQAGIGDAHAELMEWV